MEFGLQAFVPRQCRDRVEFADDQPEGLGVGDDGAHMRLALQAVAWQYVVVETATQHALEFPGQVAGVPDASAQSLAQEGRHLVRCIPHQEDALRAPLFHDQRMKSVDCRTPERECVDVDEAAPDPAHGLLGLEIFGRLSRQQLDLPAAQRAGADHVGAGARRAAILHRAGRQVDGPLDVRVDDHPPFIEGQVLDRAGQLPAHQALAAITGNQVAAGQLHGLAVVGAARAGDQLIRLLLEVGQRVAKQDLYIGKTLDATA